MGPAMSSLRALRWVSALLLAVLAAALLPAAAQAQSPVSSDFSVEKTGPSTIAPDSDITYSITVTNQGPDASNTVTLHDALPSGESFVSLTQNTGPAFSCTTPADPQDPQVVDCTAASMTSGQTATFTLVAHVEAGTEGSFITNVAQVIPSNSDPDNPEIPDDPDDENNQSPTTALVTGGVFADASVTMTAPETVSPDADLAYDITVKNNGPDAADLALSDTVPGDATFVSLQQLSGPAFSCTTPAAGAGGTVSCANGAVASGTTATFRLVVHIPATPADPSYSNSATVSTSATDDNGDNNTATRGTIVGAADVATTLNGPATAKAGETVTYTMSVFNNGPDTASPVSFADDLPANTRFVSFTQNLGSPFTLSTPSAGTVGTVSGTRPAMTSGESATFTLVVRLVPLAPAGALQNTISAESDVGDPNTANNTANASTTVTALSSDVETTLTAPAGAAPGDLVTYTLGVTNNGPDDAIGVDLTDALPANTQFESLTQETGPPFTAAAPAVGGSGTVMLHRDGLPNGSSATFSLVVRVASSAPNGTVTNTLEGSSESEDPDPSNDDASAGTAVVKPVPPTQTQTQTQTTPAPTTSTPAPVPTTATPAPRPQIKCSSDRRITFTLKRRQKRAPRRITVTVDGKVVKRYGPRTKVTVSLEGKPAKRYRVVISARYKGGKLVRRTGTYATCIE
jgi:uncharacterized repeat protein (TIGR01451 family)